MKSILPAFVLSLAALSACTSAPILPDVSQVSEINADEQAIRDVLAVQQDAWNRGDIPGFMEGYWKNEGLRFASRANVTFGWQNTLDRYLRSYDSPEKMGTLEFDIRSVDVLGPSDALVFGAWKLIRDEDTPHGLFTLHFRKIDGQWVIASDHTSGADDD